MKTAALHNLGCKVNAYETEAMQQLLEDDGYVIVPFTEKADVYVINTCSVTNMADRKSRQMIHRAKKLNPDAIVVAAGCYVQTASQSDTLDLSADIIIGNNRKNELVPEIHKYLEEHQQNIAVIDINDGVQDYETLHVTKTAEHTRVFIKIQDGCNQFCSYCVIPYARGRVRSRDKEDVIQEVTKLAESGYREVVLTGIHVSSYGVPGEYGLIDVIEEVQHIPGIERIRLGSLEPRIVTEEFAKRASLVTKLCPHFHLSLQSGCDETLKRMNRKYTTDEFYESVQYLRKYFDHPAITTDVIVGFPGETEEEFEETRRFLEKIHFYEMHVFKFSIRKGTRAERMPDQIPEKVKSARSEILINLAKKMSEEYRQEELGREACVLMEEEVEIDGQKFWTGFTKDYVRYAVKSEKNLHNRLVTGKAEQFLTDEILFIENYQVEK